MPIRRSIRDVALPVLLLGSAALAPHAHAQTETLIREVTSREQGIYVESGTLGQDAFSRELTLHIENGAPDRHVASREIDLLVSDPAPPPPVTQLSVTTSPTGQTVTLDWFAYNPWATGDVQRFDVYLSETAPFDDVSAMTPVATVGGETTAITLENLTAFTDHYLAVVAVDGQGNRIDQVDYAAAYVLTGQVASRELGIHVENGRPAASVASREIDLLVSDPAPPPAIPGPDLTAAANPLGDTVTLNWSAYNQWAVGDVQQFDIYLSDTAPFHDVTGLTPYARAGGETNTITLTDLTPFTDHYFAVVPVDGQGNHVPEINYTAAYILTTQVASRELGIFVETGQRAASVSSREQSIVVSDGTTPAPVTFSGSTFDALTSTSQLGGIDLTWPGYNELAQLDIASYRIYTADAFFDDVSAMTPATTVSAERFAATVSGLPGGTIVYVAAVAVDSSGNFDPTVFPRSALTSPGEVGEVENFILVDRTETTATFAWAMQPERRAFLSHYHLYFGDLDGPLTLTPDTTGITLEDLSPNTTYPLRLATVDRFGVESHGITYTLDTFLESTTVTIDPRATFLRADREHDTLTPPPLAVAIDLDTIGASPGDRLRLQQLGDFDFFGGTDPEEEEGFRMLAVFSTTDEILADPDLRHRVPGAIDLPDQDLRTFPTKAGQALPIDSPEREALETDIPEDFEITDTTLTIPPDAQFLIVSAYDEYYPDNSDPDQDYMLHISNLTPEIPTGTLAGRILGRYNRPISGASIEQTLNGKPHVYTADSRGLFSIPNLPTGSHTFTAKSPGYKNAGAQVLIAADQTTTKNFYLAPEVIPPPSTPIPPTTSTPTTIGGTVTNPQGARIGRVSVNLTLGPAASRTRTGSDGTFEFSIENANLPSGDSFPGTLTFSSGAFEETATNFAVDRGTTITIDQQLTPAGSRPLGGLRGTIVDARTHQPLPGASVSVRVFSESLGVTTDTDGRVTLEGVPAGTQHFTFSAPSYHSQTRPFFIRPDRLSATRIDLRPDANGETGDLKFDVLPDPDTGDENLQISWPAHWIDPDLELSTDMQTWIPAGPIDDNTLTLPADTGTIYLRMRHQP